MKNIVAGASIPQSRIRSRLPSARTCRCKEAPPTITPSSLNTVTSLVSQWGGAVGLGLFAMWALWMLGDRRRRLRGPPDVRAAEAEASINVPAPAGSGTGDAATRGQPAAAKKEKEPVVVEGGADDDPQRPRHLGKWLQATVRDNPRTSGSAVAIIGK